MTPLLLNYVVAWLSLCLLAVVLVLKDVRPRWQDELRFLAVPWKLAVFVPAVAFVTFAGRFTDDETWDVVTGAGMALLTFATSGWAVGTLYKVMRRERRASHAFIALVAMLFASSWFYDGWQLVRDGAYTVRWWSNLCLSPFAYVAAGLMLNLEAGERGGLCLGFVRRDWPQPASARVTWPMVLAASPLVAVAAYVLVGFVGWQLP
ncbi:MAG: hypothetical protein JNK82_08360 [Myxococcaceae bacterium]|nr:hypothetical protein [Myxococcaceae bacterium]